MLSDLKAHSTRYQFCRKLELLGNPEKCQDVIGCSRMDSAREWEPSSYASNGEAIRVITRGRVMKKVRRNRQHAKFARLRRHLEISADVDRPRRIRTRSARYAAALAEQLGMIDRPKCCSWCRRRRRLEVREE